MEKIWLNTYNYLPENIDSDQYSSLIDMFLTSCHQHKNKIAFSNYGTNISFKKLEKYSKKFAAYLQNHLQLKPQDKFAIMLPNILQYPIALFGAFRAGLIVVNVNPFYTNYELAHQINDAKVKTIIVLDNFINTVAKVLNKTCLETVIVTKLGDLHHFPKKFMLNFINKYVKKNVRKYEISHFDRFKNIFKSKYKSDFEDISLNNQDIAFLQYTGGTTGTPKGAILTHRNILANMEQGLACVMPKLKKGEEVIITPLPLYHIFSLTANCMAFIKIGGKNVLITNPRDIKSFVKELKKHKFTLISGVNTLFNALNNSVFFKKQVNFSKLKITLSGGMSLSKNIADTWKKITGCQIIEAYGLTEASPCITMNLVTQSEFNGSIGLPVPSTDVSIRDAMGNEVNIGECGELWAKGPQVMQGYWNNPNETAKVFSEGWLKTGDLAKMDLNGYIYLVDRLKDIINISGFNVYPTEIEAVIGSHPDVLEVGVVGNKINNDKEIVVAYVVLKNKLLTANELLTYCQERLARYKLPKKIIFAQSLPKSSVGKILRKELKAIVDKNTNLLEE